MFCKVVMINCLLMIRFLKCKSLYILSVGFTQTKIAIIEKNLVKNDDFRKKLYFYSLFFCGLK
jgi:hypothetical protein